MRELQQPTERPRREDGGTLLSTLIELWPYIWPADRPDLKSRVVFATVLLFLAKFATMAVPFTFKWATDALAGHGTAPVAANNWLVWVFAAPVALTLAYGGVRVIMALLTQWRDGIFAKVAMNAVRRL
ncbi:MAG: metal ABC transporter permease, partial [Xanthobacteraceae bacterium]